MRRDSSNEFSYRNGGGETTGAASSSSLGTTHFALMQSNAGSFYSGQIALAHAGDQLSVIEVAAFYTIKQNYLHAVGAV